MTKDRKHTKFETCDRHGWLNSETRSRRAEFFAEGGPGTGCEGGRCRIWPGRDLFVEELCANGAEWKLDWTAA